MFKKKYQIIIIYETEKLKKIIVIKSVMLNWVMAIYAKFWICRDYTNNGCIVKIEKPNVGHKGRALARPT